MSRPNKSQELAHELEVRSNARSVQISNPYQELMDKAAKHIRFLEMVCTGLSYADKRTIAALTRKLNSREQMLQRRNTQIKILNAKLKEINQVAKFELKCAHEDYKHRLQKLEDCKVSEVDAELREAIECEFINRLKTSRQLDKMEKAEELIRYRLKHKSWDKTPYTSTATTDYRWRFPY